MGRGGGMGSGADGGPRRGSRGHWNLQGGAGACQAAWGIAGGGGWSLLEPAPVKPQGMHGKQGVGCDGSHALSPGMGTVRLAVGISHPAVNSAEWWWGEGACRVGRGGSGRARSSTPLGWSQGAVVASYLCCLVSLSGAAPFQRPPVSSAL